MSGSLLLSASLMLLERECLAVKAEPLAVALFRYRDVGTGTDPANGEAEAYVSATFHHRKEVQRLGDALAMRPPDDDGFRSRQLVVDGHEVLFSITVADPESRRT